MARAAHTTTKGNRHGHGAGYDRLRRTDGLADGHRWADVPHGVLQADGLAGVLVGYPLAGVTIPTVGAVCCGSVCTRWPHRSPLEGHTQRGQVLSGLRINYVNQ